MVYEIIPTWLGSVSFLYLQQITRGPFFHCSTCRSKTFIQATKGETPPWLASNAIESLWWLWKWKRHGFKWKHGQQKRGNMENKYLPSRKKNKKNITLPNVFKDIKQKTVRESTTRSDIIENFSYLNTWFRQCLYNPYITTYSISIPKKNIPRFFVLTPRIMKLAAGRDHTPPPSSCSEPVLVIGDKT